MTKLTVKNKQANPTFVHTEAGRQPLDPGASYTGEFAPGEAANLRRNASAFEVTEHGPDGQAVTGKADPNAVPDHIAVFLARLRPIADRVNSSSVDDFADQMEKALDERDTTADAANGMIAVADKLRVPVDGINDEIDRLVENSKSSDAFVAKLRDALGINEGVGILETIAALKAKADAKPADDGPMTLLQAVQSLDDKNEAHWTNGGKPDLDTLKTLTGGDLTRAEVDALVPPRTRKTA